MAQTVHEMLVGSLMWFGAAVAAGIGARVLLGRIFR